MGQQFTLSAADAHQLGAYRADPAGTPKGGIVVVQEIFGVNNHIRNVCDAFAKEGYAAVAPALFDRTQRNFESGYTPAEIEKARAFIAKPDWDAMLRDTDAAIKVLQSAGPVGIVGFCMGGTIAFLAATRLSGLSAAVGYYGGRIVAYADEKPKCPTQLHFGEKDASIPMTDVDIIKQKRSDCEIYVYKDAGHGFHCDERGSFHKDSSSVAWERTTAFLAKHMKK
ncbi:MAG TPA: dienelactone hydrolase family protein [Xanthobacteraceae bacterium]|nr:dienelactone hydrolase family protein [Xanthobacteraceae bacterium]